MSEPTVSRKAYLFTWLSLLGLTLLTTLIGFVDLGPFSMVLAVAFAVGVIWLLILIGATLTDYISRGWLAVPGQ